MKVFVVSTLYSPNEIGGAEITARAVAEGLTARGHQVATASIAPDGKPCMREVNRVRCHYVKLANLYWPHEAGLKPALWRKLLWHALDTFNPVMAARLGKLLDSEKPDVIHMHNLQGFSVAAWRAAKRRKIPIVQTLHDYYLACPNSVMYRNGMNCTAPCAECRVFGLPRRWLSHLPTTVTAVSRRMLSRLEQRGLFAQVARKQIIYGCNLDTPDAPGRADKPPGSPLAFGFFGRIEPLKGLEVLLEAMRSLPPDKARLLIGGRAAPEYLERLKRGSGENVTFLGFTRPADFFLRIDVLVVPSLWEDPFPRVTHEAFSYGVPVYASRIGGLAEAVEPGVTGEVFTPGNASELAGLMQNAVTRGLPAGALYAATRRTAEKYALTPILDQYEQALMEAAHAPAF